MKQYIIGVDGGGSKTHAILFNKKLEQLDESFAGSANIRTDIDLAYTSITTAINTLLDKHKLDSTKVQVGIGIAGYSVVSARKQLYARLLLLYPKLKLQSDCHIACLSAHKKHDGAIIICGTGVVAYMIKDNVNTQIGGWGFPHGDLGGAAYLGLEICRLVCKALDEVVAWSPLLTTVYSGFVNATQYKSWLLDATPGDFAAIASLLPLYLTIDNNAMQVFMLGFKELYQFVAAITHKADGLPLALMGGLAIHYYPYLQKDFPNIYLSESDPALGAAYL